MINGAIDKMWHGMAPSCFELIGIDQNIIHPPRHNSDQYIMYAIHTSTGNGSVMHIPVGDKRLLLVWSHKITAAILLHKDWCGFGNPSTCRPIQRLPTYHKFCVLLLFFAEANPSETYYATIVLCNNRVKLTYTMYLSLTLNTYL